MTFNSLHSDTTCNCIEEAFEDTTSTYLRKIAKDTLREVDFRSKWEKNQRATDCEKVKGLKGVSVSKVEEKKHLEELISNYREVFCLSPKYKSHVCVFSAKEDVGMFKDRHSTLVKYHHELYKCDKFDINNLTVRSIISLNE